MYDLPPSWHDSGEPCLTDLNKFLLLSNDNMLLNCLDQIDSHKYQHLMNNNKVKNHKTYSLPIWKFWYT